MRDGCEVEALFATLSIVSIGMMGVRMGYDELYAFGNQLGSSAFLLPRTFQI